MIKVLYRILPLTLTLLNDFYVNDNAEVYNLYIEIMLEFYDCWLDFLFWRNVK
jgi:hypothetical protein